MSYMEERFQEGTLKKDTLSLETIVSKGNSSWKWNIFLSGYEHKREKG